MAALLSFPTADHPCHIRVWVNSDMAHTRTVKD